MHRLLHALLLLTACAVPVEPPPVERAGDPTCYERYEDCLKSKDEDICLKCAQCYEEMNATDVEYDECRAAAWCSVSAAFCPCAANACEVDGLLCGYCDGECAWSCP